MTRGFWPLCLVLVACGSNPPPPAAEPEPAEPALLGALSEEQDAPEATEPQAGPRGWLGVEMGAREGAVPGVLVRSIVPNSPAAKSGVLAGDVILSVDGVKVQRPEDVVRLVAARKVGDRVALAMQRNDKPRLVAAVLERMPAEDEVMRMSYVGKSAPSLVELKLVQGSLTPSLGALRGKVVVLEFWATWCGVCQFLVPTMNEWYGHYGAQGVEFLAITMDPVDAALLTAQQLSMNYPVASDPSGDTTRAYRGFALPTLFVIDQKGTVREVLVGYSQDGLGRLRATMDKLLAEG